MSINCLAGRAPDVRSMAERLALSVSPEGAFLNSGPLKSKIERR